MTSKAMKRLRILGLALAIGMAAVGCDTGNGGSGDSAPRESTEGTIVNYKGNGVLKASYSTGPFDYKEVEIGTVKGGKFTFYLKNIPVSTAALTDEFFGSMYSKRKQEDNPNWNNVGYEIRVFPNTSKITVANIVLETDDPGDPLNGHRLVLGNETGAHSSVYMYSDNDRQTVKINFEGEYKGSIWYEEDYNLSLGQGWQMVYVDDVSSGAAHTKTFSKTRPSDSKWYLIEPPQEWDD